MWGATDMFGFHQDFNRRTSFEIVADRRSQNVQQSRFRRRTGFTNHRIGTDQSRTQVQRRWRIRNFFGRAFDQFNQSIQISLSFRARQVQDIRTLLHTHDIGSRAEHHDFAVYLTKCLQTLKTFAAVMQGMRAGGDCQVFGRLPFYRLPFTFTISDNGHFSVKNAAEYGWNWSAHDDCLSYSDVQNKLIN